MIDREKVITGLGCLADENSACHSDCPYFADREDGGFCFRKMAHDALKLMKEQESKPVLYRDDGEYCPWCSTVSTRTMGVQRLHRGTRYCPYCGQAVKWE